MSESGTLKIHASIRPDVSKAPKITSIEGEAPMSRGRVVRARRRGRLSRADRLLRNSAYACALLLGVLALGNVNQPWARKASESVEKALTMRIDLDETIGSLQFVKRLMPELALVFMNLSGGAALERPVAGAVSHPWTNLQPWMMFDCDAGAAVVAAAPGTVTAVTPLSGDRYGVLLDHGEGVETVYARLSEASVSPGDGVSRGDALGTADGSVYFEYRKGGEAADPTAELGLQ